MPREAVMIKAADMLHNLQSLLADLEDSEDRDDVWHRFNAGSESQQWYFTSVVEAVRSRLGDHRLVTELEAAIAGVKNYV
jgi:hypothetical protein